MKPLWVPDTRRAGSSHLAAFLRAAGFTRYEDLWEWSVGPDSTSHFWRMVAERAEILWFDEPSDVLVKEDSEVAGAVWFPGGRLNYAERCLRTPIWGGSSLAVRARSQAKADEDLTWDDLRSLVSRVRAGLVAADVGVGQCVAAYVPNVPEALAMMLASASLGAVWTCCAPEMGAIGSLDRLSQCEPTVLLAVDGYRFGSREIDRRDTARAIKAGLPSVERAVWLPYLFPEVPAPDGWITWDEFTAEDGEIDFLPVPFDHPLYVLYSSGTTGKPKAIVHSHGGIMLEHAKALSLHFDIGKGDVFFWFTTTGWMMWNFCVSGLLVDSTVVLYDGDPAGPEGDNLWRLMDTTGATCGGVGAGYLVAGMKAGDRPGRKHDLARLRTLGSTGSPLPASAAEWVYGSVSEDVLLASFSGGTDVCTGFVGGSPMHPVWAGEISCRCLGAGVEVYDGQSRSVVGHEGELVLTTPLPSMPVGLLCDVDGSRYRATYFEQFPGVWSHGDRATLTERGTVIITGRSDGTLNRGGVRVGTAELYAVVEGLPDVVDSLAVHLEDPGGGPGTLMLFVVPVEGVDTAELAERIRGTLRHEMSPRHVPDVIEFVQSVPRNMSGKKLEVPIKRILAGADLSSTVALTSMADPRSLEPFIELARKLRSQPTTLPNRPQ